MENTEMKMRIEMTTQRIRIMMIEVKSQFRG